MILTRSRTTDDRDSTGVFTTATYPDGEFELYWPNVNKIGLISTILDNNNGNFQKLKNRGYVVMSDCNIVKSERTMSQGSYSCSVPYGNGFWEGHEYGDVINSSFFTGHPLIAPRTSDGSEFNTNTFLIQAYAKMKATSVMSGEILSDLGKTVSMLKRPLSSARDLIARMSKQRNKRKWKNAVDASKATADAWLEVRYGMMPLLLDCETTIDEAHKIYGRQFKVHYKVARAGGSVNYDDKATWSASGASQRCNGSYSVATKASCGVGVYYKVLPRSTSEELAAIFGFRASDLPATLWETTPYSFVVDWFVNIGDWIQAITPTLGIVPISHWASTVVSSTSIRSGDLVAYQPTDWHGHFGSETIKTFSFQRVCNQKITFIPSWKYNFTRIHQIDAIALLVQPLVKAVRKMR